MKKRSRKSRTKTPARPAHRAKVKAAPRAAVLRTVLLGAPLAITYRHAHGGSYRHKFGRGARISVTPDGRTLVIDGINVKQFIEG